jgi:hypothetical protein
VGLIFSFRSLMSIYGNSRLLDKPAALSTLLRAPACPIFLFAFSSIVDTAGDNGFVYTPSLNATQDLCFRYRP